MIDIYNLRRINSAERITLTEHARMRLVERGILIEDIVSCIANGEIIKQYEDDKPFPSCLILGMSIENKYLHVVVSTDNEYIFLITAYFPSSDRWEADFKTRKEC